MSVGEKLKEARKEKNLTQKQLAQITGIAYQHIGRWERDEIEIGLTNLKKLAKALDKTLDDLAGD